jgi:hypothetical protein
VSSLGLLAGWNNGLGFWLGWLRNNGLAIRITSSDEDPILESALDWSFDLPHTHLSSSAKVTPVEATNTNNAVKSGTLLIFDVI